MACKDARSGGDLVHNLTRSILTLNPHGGDRRRERSVFIGRERGRLPCLFACGPVFQHGRRRIGIADRQRRRIGPEVGIAIVDDLREQGRFRDLEGQRLYGLLPGEVGHMDFEDVQAVFRTAYEDHRQKPGDVEHRGLFVLHLRRAGQFELEERKFSDRGLNGFVVEDVHAGYADLLVEELRGDFDAKSRDACRSIDRDRRRVGQVALLIHRDVVCGVQILSRPVERRSPGRPEGDVGGLFPVEHAGCEFPFGIVAGDGHRADLFRFGDDVEREPVVVAGQDVEVGLECVGCGSRSGVEAQSDDVRPGPGVEDDVSPEGRDVEVDALGRERLFVVLRRQQDVADRVAGARSALHRQVEDRGETVEAESDLFTFIGFTLFGIAESEHLGHEGVRCAVELAAFLTPQVPEGNAGRVSADRRMGVEGHVLPLAGRSGKFALEGERVGVVDEPLGFRECRASGYGVEHAHGVSLFPCSGEPVAVHVDVGAGLVLVDRGMESDKGSAAGRCRGIGFVAVAACEQGDENDRNCLINRFHGLSFCSLFGIFVIRPDGTHGLYAAAGIGVGKSFFDLHVDLFEPGCDIARSPLLCGGYSLHSQIF